MSRWHRALWTVLCAFSSALLIAGCGGGGGGYDGGGSPPAPPAAPTVNLTVPNASSVNRTVTLTANVVAAAGVTRVEFLVDGTVAGTVTAAPYTFAWDTSAVMDGNHALAARVTDQQGRTVTSGAVNIVVMNRPRINVTASAAEIIAQPASTARGTGELTFNMIDGAVTGGVTLEGVTASAVSLHEGYAGAEGPGLINFAATADPNRWEAPTASLLTAEQIDALMAGRLYLLVRSLAYPQGEIRGQIRPSHIEVVFTSLSGGNVVPPVSIEAGGLAATTVDSRAGTATVFVQTTGVDDATAAHVHQAAAGANNTTALFALTRDAADPSRWSAEQQAITATDRDNFRTNGWYIDVHTAANPDGAIRGQITPNPPPPPAAAKLSELQSMIFTPMCAGCHNGAGTSLPGVMNLSSAAASFASLVGVASIESPAVPRVDPGNPSNSYLVQKLEGSPGIVGQRMPPGGPFLDGATLDKVRSWITSGAANN